MKKFIIASVLILFSIVSLAQTAVPVSTSPSTTNRIMPFLMGTGQTSGGVFVYKFDSPQEMEYSVVLTPLTDNTNLYITDKSAEGFSIKTTNGGESSFDYVVFVNRKNPAPEKTE